MSYFRIIPVASKHHGIFDTITEVAKATGMRYRDIMLKMGFESNADLLAHCNQNPHPYFSKTAFIAGRLNSVCRELHAPVRIVRPIREIGEERSNHEYR